MEPKVAILILVAYICRDTNGDQKWNKSQPVVLEDGESLLEIGEQFDNPLLRMLGQVFINTENLVGKAKAEIFEDLCDLHPCSAWSKWSECTAKETGSYGIQSRRRRCGLGSPFCIQPSPKEEEPTSESDVKICEGACKHNYNLTNGFCLRFNDETVSKDEADDTCANDGGYVININSEAKSNALHELLKSYDITQARFYASVKGLPELVLHNKIMVYTCSSESETIWIDGRRKSVSSSWTFLNGRAPEWTNWYGGEPTNGTDEKCRVEENSARKWFDRNCNGPYRYVCEITNEDDE